MKIIMVITNKLGSFANIAFEKTKNFLIESHNLFKFSECRIRSNYIQTHIEEINSEIKKNGEKKKLLYDALQECPCVPEIYEGAFNQMVLEKKDIEEILRLIEFAGVQKLVMFRLNERKNPAIEFFDKSIPIEATIKKEPIIPNVIFDMHGAVEYANKKGVKISELSDDEKKLFVKEKIAALRA